MTYIGIDPSGGVDEKTAKPHALVRITNQGWEAKLVTTGTSAGCWELYKWLCEYGNPQIAYLESQVFVHNNKVAIDLGVNRGELQALLKLAGVQIELVHPSQWKGTLNKHSLSGMLMAVMPADQWHAIFDTKLTNITRADLEVACYLGWLASQGRIWDAPKKKTHRRVSPEVEKALLGKQSKIVFKGREKPRYILNGEELTLALDNESELAVQKHR